MFLKEPILWLVVYTPKMMPALFTNRVVVSVLWYIDKALFTYQDPDYELSPDLQSKANYSPPTAWTFPQGTLVSDQTDCVSPGGTQHWHCVQAYQYDQEYQDGQGFLKCEQLFNSRRET